MNTTTRVLISLLVASLLFLLSLGGVCKPAIVETIVFVFACIVIFVFMIIFVFSSLEDEFPRRGRKNE